MGYVFRTPEQQMAVDGLRRYLDAEIEPIVKQYRDKFIEREKMAEITRGLTQYGLVSGVVSEQHGGMGIGWLTHLMLFEELAFTSSDLSTVVLVNTGGASLIELRAPARLRERYLPGLIAGDLFISIGISELTSAPTSRK